MQDISQSSGRVRTSNLAGRRQAMAKKQTPNKKKNNRVTINEVAAHAGVAISSISRVLSGHVDTSDAMKKRVEESVKALGYEPDYIAQSLRRGETKTIGFMLRDITNPMFSVVAQSCESELRKAGYSMIYMNSDADIEIEKSNFSLVKRRRLDGLIVSLVSEEVNSVKGMINHLGAPVVLLDREVSGADASTVLCNHEQGVYSATIDLIQKGHERIVFISGKNSVFSTRNRLKGFERAFAEKKIPIPQDLIRLGSFSEIYAYQEVKDLFSTKKRPTALLAGGVGASTGALHAFKELGISPVVDVAFIALDEWPMFSILSDSFSSVFRDPEAMGRESARLIVDILSGKDSTNIVIPTVYRERASSKENKLVRK